jgi:hypothetical protein
LKDRELISIEKGKGHKNLIKVTEKGEEALRDLDELRTKAGQVSLGFLDSNADGHKVQLSLDEEHMSDLDRISILLIPEVLESLRRTMHALISSWQNKFTLRIQANLPSIAESPIMSMMYDMIRYFEMAKRAVRSVLPPKSMIKDCGSIRPEDLSDRILYRAYFKLKLGPVIKRLGKEIKEKELIEELELPEDFLRQLGEPTVRNWITKMLEKDPDFFMPHGCWVKLGISREQTSQGEIDVTPPSWTMLFSAPEREEKIMKLVECLEGALAKLEWRKFVREPELDRRLTDMHKRVTVGSDLQQAYDTLHSGILDFASDPEFYEYWKIVRKIDRYHNDFPEAHQILQKAHAKCISSGKNIVNLAKVFADLAHGRCTLQEAKEGIGKGHYRMKPGEKMVWDPLLTKREKRIFRSRGGV